EDDFSIIVRRVMVLENLNCLFALVSMEDHVYLIARSRIAEINAGDIARDFGGGGHASAASATIRNMSLVEAQEKLIRSLHRHISPQAMAKEMLSSPVISIPAHTSIQEANTLLTRYNITVLPVLADDEQFPDTPLQIVGTIARRITEKAIHHNLGEAPVSDYMTSDIEVLPLSATLAEIEELIIERRQRLIPIIHEKELTGVITRTDLLSRLTGDPGHTPQELIQDTDYPSRRKRRNILQLMTDVLDKKLIILLQSIGEVAEESGFKAYTVGGFVRDLLLKQKNLDLDIVVEGDGIAFAKKLAKRLGGKVRTHERFITAKLWLPNGFKIDIATARLEYYDYPAALPTVELSSIKLDLYRRDFSINAMALELNPSRYGTLIDFFNCQNDLKNRLVKVLHNLSFVEDPSRILRAIRFEKRLNFKIDRHTEKLIRNAVKIDLFTKSSIPRLFSELQQVFSEETPIPAIQRLEEFNLFQFLWPDLKPNLKIDRYFRHVLTQTRRAISWFRLLYLEENNEIVPWRIYLLSIMSRSKAAQLESFCKRFQISEKICRELILNKLQVEELAEKWHRHLPEANSVICKSLCLFSNDMLLYFMAIAKKSEINKRISLYVTTLRAVQPLLNGNDLQELGYNPGKTFKEMLSTLRNAQLDGAVNNRQEAIAFTIGRFQPLPQ
ncbi:MAG: prohead protease, partial [Desulfocapsa sp.]